MPSLPLLHLDGTLIDHAVHFVCEALASDQSSLLSRDEQHPTLSNEDTKWQEHASSLGFSTTFNASAILAAKQQYQVQVIATTFSSISILAALCAIYWFYMMRRNFRRDLILLLIIGDLWKSFWLLIFPVVSLSKGHVNTDTPFCQAAGYLLQTGLISCDVAIVLMSTHMSLQIFPPRKSFLGHDGLYRIRWWAIGAWIALPNLSASLAFVNRGPGYVSQGGFCSLPIRPFWYRLALSWIPRYLVWVYIMGVAIRIYRHVGYEFKVFGQEKDRSSSLSIPGAENSFQKQRRLAHSNTSHQGQSAPSSSLVVGRNHAVDDNVAPDDDGIIASDGLAQSDLDTAAEQSLNSNRRQSMPSWLNSFAGGNVSKADSGNDSPLVLPVSLSTPVSRRGSRQIATGVFAEDFAPPFMLDSNRKRGSISTMESKISSVIPSIPGLHTIKETHRSSSASEPPRIVNQAMQQRRIAIQRQLRLLFIYPIVYCLMWIMPFVAHALSYSNRYAQHPVFTISALNVVFLGSMGWVDVLVFCWREKPWRHIPGSRGTFFGSFLFWEYTFGNEWHETRRPSHAPKSPGVAPKREATDLSDSQKGPLTSLKRWSMSISGRGHSNRNSHASTAGTSASRPATMLHRRAYSGGSDRRIRNAEQAHERLAMERAEFEQNQAGYSKCRSSVISELEQGPPGRKEWWDRKMSLLDDAHDEK